LIPETQHVLGSNWGSIPHHHQLSLSSPQPHFLKLQPQHFLMRFPSYPDPYFLLFDYLNLLINIGLQ
jgi:hypothetical protein